MTLATRFSPLAISEKPMASSFGLLVRSVAFAKRAVFLVLNPVRVLLPVLGRSVVPMLTLGALQGYYLPHANSPLSLKGR